ncbi:minor tail protein [Mycobacterium phage Aziz]|uniref:Minor tail protein n=1 Tax=Mycobacterium phage Aziz TaxID=2762281 RepID=A0A7G8LHG9_9CAUD|nr:minor tail protein [Mycobacterium phage Aziz]ASR75878.1 minor tail protein [Mycobacterium phage GenevaB15]QNJ56691.1 minor tail protein [Mycobacterium phage Aziz]
MDTMDYTAKIEIFGVHGEYFCVSGPGKGEQGVELMPKLKGMIDAPVKSLWLPGAYGQTFVDFRWERRDVVFTVNIFADDGHPETWRTIDSRWRFAFDYVKEARVRFTTSDGWRELKVRLLEEPQAYDSGDWEGKDPALYACSTVVMTLAAELPFFVGPSDFYEFSGESASSRKTFKLNVDCDVPVWPKWTLTDKARWRLPDFSWGNQEYGRGIEDSGRTVVLPYLPKGAGCVANSDPRVQTLLAKNKMHLQGLWKGQDLLYPIAGGTYSRIPVAVNDATGGFAARLEVPKWYTRPWSRPVGAI